MERAQRAADSPLKAILEASRARRRVDPDGAATADVARRATPRVANAGLGSNVGAGAQGTAATPAPAVATETPVITLRTLPNEAPAQAPRRSGAIEPSAIAPLARPAAPLPQAELPRLPRLAETGATRPELLQMVEPEVGPRLLEQLTRAEVWVEFTIRVDGSVTGVQVLPPVPRQMISVLVAALEQWRYAPLAAPRQHRVQLVFKNEP